MSEVGASALLPAISFGASQESIRTSVSPYVTLR